MIRTRAVLCSALFALTGCLSPGDDSDKAGDGGAGPELSTLASDVTVRNGVDYSFARPSPSGIHAAGYTFAVRYLSYSSGKNLTASEARALEAAGVDVVSNWEAAADDALDGRARGVSDAQEADRQATADGAPAGRPIYFSVDFDATPGQQAVINDYFDGVASVIGRARTGAYGGYYVIKRLFDAGKISFGWQTYAWSGGQWDDRAQLRQVQNNVTVAGGACDIDQARANDFGQWGAATSVPPGPVADVEKIASARNADGTVEVFWLGAGGAIHHARQAGSGWTADEVLGGAGKKLAVAANADGRLEVFYVGTDGQLYHRVQLPTGGWSGEIAFGTAASEIAVGRNADGRLEAFFTASNGAISHAWQTAANAGWTTASSFGGAAKDIVVGANADGRLEVFYIGTNNLLYHRVEITGGWSSEIGFGVAASDLAVGRNVDGRLELFYAGGDNAIAHVWQTAANGSWGAPAALGGKARQLTVGANADGRLEVFYAGTDGQLYHRVEITGGWSGEITFGAAGRDVSVAPNKDGRLELFYAGASGALSHGWQTAANGNWSAGSSLVGSVE